MTSVQQRQSNSVITDNFTTRSSEDCDVDVGIDVIADEFQVSICHDGLNPTRVVRFRGTIVVRVIVRKILWSCIDVAL